MDKRKLIIIKLGGSLITDKNKLFEIKYDAIERVAEEFRMLMNHFKFIIVHGGGSFGHPIAKKYRLHKGFIENKQVIGFSKTRYYMTFLNQMIVKSFIEKDIPLTTVHASSIFILRNREISSFFSKPIEMSLSLNIIPMIFGDVVLDEVKGFSILSGDQIASELALKFKADEVIFGTDVEGIYTDNPKINMNAKFIQKIYYKNLLKAISFTKRSRESDVTGEMENKIKEIIRLAEKNIYVKIGNLSIPRMLSKMLYNLSGKYTIITPHPTKTIIID